MVSCAVLLAAGWVSLHSLTGVDIVGNVLDDAQAVCPVEVRDGHVWLMADGKEMDITGLFDEQTPYIYRVEVTESGVINHIVVGGTPDNLEYMDVLTGLEEINGWPCAISGRGASWGGAETPKDADAIVAEHGRRWKDWVLVALEKLVSEVDKDYVYAVWYFEAE